MNSLKMIICCWGHCGGPSPPQNVPMNISAVLHRARVLRRGKSIIINRQREREIERGSVIGKCQVQRGSHVLLLLNNRATIRALLNNGIIEVAIINFDV